MKCKALYGGFLFWERICLLSVSQPASQPGSPLSSMLLCGLQQVTICLPLYRSGRHGNRNSLINNQGSCSGAAA
jgi:hypothetical protein